MVTTLIRSINPPGSIYDGTRVQQPSYPIILINAHAAQKYRIVGFFFEVLKFREWPIFQFFRDFIFTNVPAKAQHCNG